MKIGIGTYTLPWAFGIGDYPRPRDPMTADALLDIAHAEGVDVVQIADNVSLHELPAEDVRSLSEKAKRLGIEVELGTRGIEPSQIRTYIELCRQCSARTLRSVPGPRANVDRIERQVADVVEELANAGVTLCIENYEGVSVRALAEIVRRIGSPSVRICLDSLNSLGRGEGFEEVVNSLGRLTANLHVKDYNVERLDHRLGFLVSGRPAGEGDLPLRDLISRVPRSCNAVVELWTPWQGDIASTCEQERRWMRRSITNLRKILHE